MPSWLTLILFLLGLLLVCGLEAGAVVGRWRVVWEAFWRIGRYWLLLALPAILVALWVLALR